MSRFIRQFRRSLGYLFYLLLVVQLFPFAVAATTVTVNGSMDLRPGLNLVGLPVDPALVADAQSLLLRLGNADQIDRVLRLNPVTQLYEEVAYDDAGSIVGDNFPLPAGEAWLVYAKTDFTLNYDVTLTCPQYRLQPGINLLGFPHVADTLTAFSLMDVLGGAAVVSSVQGVDPLTGRVQTATYDDKRPAGTDFPITPERGYLIMMNLAAVHDPTAVLSSVAPGTIDAGSAGVSITLSGSNFVPASLVNFGTSILTPAAVSDSQIQVTVPATELVNPGLVQVSVTSLAPGCGTTNPVALEIRPNDVEPDIVSVAGIDAVAYENSGSALRDEARIEIVRSGTLQALTVYFSVTGSTDPAEGSADASDYVIEDVNGTPLAGFVHLPAGVASAQLVISPVLDSIHEYPEVVTLTVTPHPDYAISPANSERITIADARDLAENRKLFVGLHRPEPGVETVGFGVATLVLNGPNTIATVSNSFSALTSTQVNTHVHKAQLAPDGLTLLPGSPVGEITTDQGTPLLGQLVDYAWTIGPSGAYSAQTIIDSIFGQNDQTPLYLNVHTMDYPTGEVWAFFRRLEGSTELEIPLDPPAIEDVSGNELARDVVRFLTQATFGPAPGEAQAMVDEINTIYGGDRMAAFSAWIDAQFALEQASALDYTLAVDNQEWVLREHFAYPAGNYSGPGPVPASPPLPAAWPAYGGTVEAFDSLDPATWRMPDGPYPLSQTEINVEVWFTPRLGQVNYNNRRRAQWTLMAQAHDQLRQRLAHAWSEIMVVSANDTTVRNYHYGAARYFDMLGENADDTYRELLEDVTYSPIMGAYLSSLKNQKAIVDPATGDVLISPDENLAREIMQLFSIGLIHRHLDGTIKLGADLLPISTYDNTDITELARVLTGLSFSKYANNPAEWVAPLDNDSFNRSSGNKYYGARFEYPMKMFADFHDPDPKTILDDVLIDNTDESDLALRGHADISDALDALSNHPNTAPFISRLLIQRLVASNPSRGYIYRVARVFEDNGSGVRGDLRAVTKAILLDYEARSLDLVSTATFGKQKEPLVRYIALLRALGSNSQLPLSDLTPFGFSATQLGNFPAGATRHRYGNTDSRLGQTPQRAPTVFNWFLPDFQPGGAISAAGLFAPEFQITTETQTIEANNYDYNISFFSNGQGVSALPNAADNLADNIRIDLLTLETLWNDFVGTEEEKDVALFDRLDSALTAGQFKAKYAAAATPNPRSIIIDVMTALDTGTSGINQKVRHAIYLIATSPGYRIQK